VFDAQRCARSTAKNTCPTTRDCARARELRGAQHPGGLGLRG
jgi:hypothetical protein